MSYVIHVNESCPFPPRHVTHMWMSHVTHVTDASDIHDMSLTCKWHVWDSHSSETFMTCLWHASDMSQTCNESHVWDSHSWHVSDTSLASIWQMQVTFIWMQMTCLNESRHARHMHDVTHSHSLRQVTCIHIKLSSNYVKYTGMSSVIDVNESCPLPSPTSRTTHSLVWHESFTCSWRGRRKGTWLIHVYHRTHSSIFDIIGWKFNMDASDLSQSHAGRDSFTCVWHDVGERDMTHSRLSQNSFQYIWHNWMKV